MYGLGHEALPPLATSHTAKAADIQCADSRRLASRLRFARKIARWKPCHADRRGMCILRLFSLGQAERVYLISSKAHVIERGELSMAKSKAVVSMSDLLTVYLTVCGNEYLHSTHTRPLVSGRRLCQGSKQ